MIVDGNFYIRSLVKNTRVLITYLNNLNFYFVLLVFSVFFVKTSLYAEYLHQMVCTIHLHCKKQHVSLLDTVFFYILNGLYADLYTKCFFFNKNFYYFVYRSDIILVNLVFNQMNSFLIIVTVMYLCAS